MKNKKHIVHIIPTLNFGGAERIVVDIVNKADKNKFKFSIIVFSHELPLKEEITSPDTEVILIEKKGKLSFGLVKELKKTLQKIKPDIVHTHLFGADFWGRRAAHKLSIPIITTEHNINNNEGYLKHFLKRRLRKYSQAYAACSEAVRDYMKKSYKISTPIKVIRPGVDLSRFENLKFSACKPPIRLLILGRLTKQKGHRIALQALSELESKDWNLSIVGDGEEKKNLKNLTEKLELEDQIKFLPPTHNVERIFDHADILLVPSLWEGLGIVVMEAMAAGRLIVGSRIGGIPELVDHDENGFLFQAGNEKHLAKRLEWIFQNPAKISPLMQAARKKAKQEFGLQKMIEEYEKIYLSIK